MREITRLAWTFPELDQMTEQIEAEYSVAETFKAKFDEKKWREPRILGALLAMQGEVCAYCQGLLTPSDRGDVDHFRPKSIYWWLAYHFSNYFLTCMRCNRVRKGKKFPLENGEPGLQYNDDRDLDDEQRLLLDPCHDPVEQRIKLKREGKAWMLKPVSREGVNDPQAEETIRFFELNLGKIPGVRLQKIEEALEEAKRFKAGLVDATKAKKMASRFQAYGVFVRRIFSKRGWEPLLPTPRDEMRFLIVDLRMLLDTYEDSLQAHPQHQDTISLREATLWALAAIWEQPPSGVSSGEISKWLGNKYRPQVRALIDQP